MNGMNLIVFFLSEPLQARLFDLPSRREAAAAARGLSAVDRRRAAPHVHRRRLRAKRAEGHARMSRSGSVWEDKSRRSSDGMREQEQNGRRRTRPFDGSLRWPPASDSAG